MTAFGPVLRIERIGAIAHIAFDRPEKRNAINDATIDALRDFFAAPPDGVRAVVLSGTGGHFSAGLDLSEQVQRRPARGDAPFAQLACRYGIDPVRRGAGRRSTERRGNGRRAGDRRGLPCAGRR